jgi:AbrB family looped-hinge helix DNA binding protein
VILDGDGVMAYANAMITTITGKNQVTVPAALARLVNIHPGTRLDWELADEETLLVRVLPDPASLASQLCGSGRRYKRQGVDAVENLVRERERDDRERG